MAEAEIRHVFGDTPITEASIGAAPPDILVKLSVTYASARVTPRATQNCSGKCHPSNFQVKV